MPGADADDVDHSHSGLTQSTDPVAFTESPESSLSPTTRQPARAPPHCVRHSDRLAIGHGRATPRSVKFLRLKQAMQIRETKPDQATTGVQRPLGRI